MVIFYRKKLLTHDSAQSITIQLTSQLQRTESLEVISNRTCAALNQKRSIDKFGGQKFMHWNDHSH